MEHFKTACEPYYYEHINPYTGKKTIKQKYSDMIQEDKSLLNLVAAFVKQSSEHIKDKEREEKQEAKL